MTFVYSNWYIVIAILLLGIVGCIVGFILMDKKDRELIQEFVKSNSAPVDEPVATEPTAEVSETKEE